MKAYKYFLVISIIFCSSVSAGTSDRTKIFKVSPGGELSLSVNSGEIRLNTWDKNEVQVTVRGLYDENTSDLKIAQEQNNVRVRFNGGWSDPDELVFVVSTPARYNLDLRTSSGDISLSGNVKGIVRAFTNGGDIKTGSIDGNTTINTQGGDITAGNISGNAEVYTSGGDILLGKISGTADISTMGGDVTVEEISKKVNIKTHGGDIRVGNTGGDTELFTFGGDIIVRFANGNCRLSTHGGDIKLDGAKGIVAAKTYGGDLRILNVTGAVEAVTSSGDITVELYPANSNSSKIVTQNGSILFSISEQAKAEITANVRLIGSDHEDEEVNINSEFKSKSHEQNSRSIKDTFVLNGGGVKIQLESTNYGIKIRKLIN